MLYAQDRWAVLLIFQAMDAAGKDGAIKHVMSGVNPQGCQVFSFKAPCSEELDHDYLWRCIEVPARARPDRHLQPLLLRGDARRARAPGVPREAEAAAAARHQGHLEGALRGHPRLRALPRAQRHRGAASSSCTSRRRSRRSASSSASTSPEKNWKFSANDAKERSFWDDYMEAYEDMIRDDRHQARAVVRRARRQQVVHAAGGRRGRHQRARLAGSRVSGGRRGAASGACRREAGAAGRQVAGTGDPWANARHASAFLHRDRRHPCGHRPSGRLLRSRPRLRALRHSLPASGWAFRSGSSRRRGC